MTESQLGRYIVIEGTDGAGKTTQAEILRETLKKQGIKSKKLLEPGGTVLGQALRQLILDPNIEKDPETEFDMFTAGRRRLAIQEITPSVEAGELLVCDRNWFSSVAYQGYGGGMNVEEIIKRSELAMGKFAVPDGMVILDVSPEVSKERVLTREDKQDWFESKPADFFERVRDGYLYLADRYDIEVIDGSKSLEKVASDVFRSLGQIAINRPAEI